MFLNQNLFRRSRPVEPILVWTAKAELENELTWSEDPRGPIFEARGRSGRWDTQMGTNRSCRPRLRRWRTLRNPDRQNDKIIFRKILQICSRLVWFSGPPWLSQLSVLREWSFLLFSRSAFESTKIEWRFNVCAFQHFLQSACSLQTSTVIAFT